MSNHVSLLKDMRRGINCRLEAIAAIESCEQHIAELEAEVKKQTRYAVMWKETARALYHKNLKASGDTAGGE